MWLPAIRSVSCKNLLQFNHFTRLKSVLDFAHSSSYLSYSSFYEQTLNGHNENSGVSHHFSELNSFQVTQILDGLRKEPSTAVSFFKKLKEDGFRHDVGTYTALIKILCYWGMNMCLDSVLLEVIKSKKGELDFGMSDLCEALAEGLKGEGPFSLVKAFDVLVKAYVSVGMFDEAIVSLFKTQRRGFVPSILACNCLMNGLFKCGKFDMTVAIYRQLKRLGFNPNVYTYVIVIKALCRKGSLEEAVDVFQEMDEAGVAPDPFTYAAYMQGLCLHGRTDLGYQLLQAWKEAKVPIHVFAHSAVIQGFVSEMKLKEAEGVLVSIEQEGLALDPYCYGPLIQGYSKSGNILKALSLHNEMLSKGIKTDCIIISPILQCLC